MTTLHGTGQNFNHDGREVPGPAALRSLGLALCRPLVGKNPTDPGWPTRSLEPDDFRLGDPVGIICGPLSNCNRAGHALVVVDADIRAAVEKAGDYLQPTGMRDGRPSKPDSHWCYLVPFATVPPEAHSTAAQAALEQRGHPGPKLRHFAHPDTGENILDFVGTGGQVVAPPSLHPSGEVRAWSGGEPGEPAVVPYPELWSAVCRLAEACGWKPRPAVRAAPSAAPAVRFWHPDDVIRRAAAYVAQCPGAVSGRGGHGRTFAVARALVYGFDLGVDVGFRLLRDLYNPKCDPPWTEAELWHKAEDADQTPFGRPRGWFLAGRPIRPRGRRHGHGVIRFSVEVG
jgi:Bifunctional DNA primase/polymerase, N-terminal